MLDASDPGLKPQAVRLCRFAAFIGRIDDRGPPEQPQFDMFQHFEVLGKKRPASNPGVSAEGSLVRLTIGPLGLSVQFFLEIHCLPADFFSA